MYTFSNECENSHLVSTYVSASFYTVKLKQLLHNVLLFSPYIDTLNSIYSFDTSHHFLAPPDYSHISLLSKLLSVSSESLFNTKSANPLIVSCLTHFRGSKFSFLGMRFLTIAFRAKALLSIRKLFKRPLCDQGRLGGFLFTSKTNPRGKRSQTGSVISQCFIVPVVK